MLCVQLLWHLLCMLPSCKPPALNLVCSCHASLLHHMLCTLVVHQGCCICCSLASRLQYIVCPMIVLQAFCKHHICCQAHTCCAHTVLKYVAFPVAHVSSVQPSCTPLTHLQWCIACFAVRLQHVMRVCTTRLYMVVLSARLHCNICVPFGLQCASCKQLSCNVYTRRVACHAHGNMVNYAAAFALHCECTCKMPYCVCATVLHYTFHFNCSARYRF
jgi:hypothetical protein